MAPPGGLVCFKLEFGSTGPDSSHCVVRLSQRISPQRSDYIKHWEAISRQLDRLFWWY